MKYHTQKELDNRIESIIKKTVKYYYTDWKNYDRPKYMGMKGSFDRNDKILILLVRESGTYLIRQADVFKEEWPTTLYTYFHTQDKSDYYKIDLNKLEISRIANPAAYETTLKRAV